MSGDTIASLAYLGMLGLALIGYVALAARKEPTKTAQQAIIWALIFVGVVAGFGLWEDVRKTVHPRQSVFDDGLRVEIPAERDGHYYLTLLINEQPVRFVVDTGASDMVLSIADAAKIGFRAEDLKFRGIASTANGTVQTARITLPRVALGGFVEFDVPAVVNGGELDTSLLGMRYLSRWGRVEFNDTRMVLSR